MTCAKLVMSGMAKVGARLCCARGERAQNEHAIERCCSIMRLVAY